jgi:hypothetical protein
MEPAEVNANRCARLPDGQMSLEGAVGMRSSAGRS